MTRKPSSDLQRPSAGLGPAWSDWLAGDRSALAALAARAGDAALPRPQRAAAVAAAALLAEHQTVERFALRPELAAQLGALVCETASHPLDADALAALAAAGVLESYGEWPPSALVDAAALRAAVAGLLEGEGGAIGHAAGEPDLLLLACCGLGEWCEREGREAAFERVAVAATLIERSAAVAAWSRVHWRIVVAWHGWALGRRDEAQHALAEAQQLAREAGLAAGAILAELQAARLVTSGTHPAAAPSSSRARRWPGWPKQAPARATPRPIGCARSAR